jgi:hypothetical protein
MKLALNLFLILLCSCSTSNRPDRSIASPPVRVLDIDLQKSDVQIFPVVASEDGLWYYFYVQLKNKSGVYIDCEASDVVLKTTTGKELEFKFERLLLGRFYITLEKTAGIDSSQIDFFVNGKALKEKFKLHVRFPDKDQSKITKISNENNKLIFQLRLLDKSGRPVELIDKPEIIMEGMGNIEEIRKLNDGLWEFSVIYPDENQIMYFSVRAQGVYLQKIYRHQHVEK